MVSRIKKKFGSVLAFVLIVLFVMTIVTFAIATLSSRNLDNVVGQYWEDRARFGAFSGVQRALTELSADSSFDASGTAFQNVPLEGDPEVTWSIYVVNLADPPAPGEWGPDGKTWIPDGCIYINSVANLRTVASASVSSLVAIVAPHRPVFDNALHARNRLTLVRSTTNSWYSATEFGEKLAHVSSNSTANNAITLDDSEVDGDAIAGVDPTETTTPFNLINGASVRGITRWADETMLTPEYISPIARSGTPPPDVAADLIDPGGPYGTLRRDNANIVLNGGGNYFFQGSIELSRGSLTIAGGADPENPVKLYVDGNIILNRNVAVNFSGGQPESPRGLQIYSTDQFASANPTMHLESEQLSFVAAGRALDVEMFGCDFWGSIIAENITATDTAVFYDLRLPGVPMDGNGTFTILSTKVQTKGEAELALATAPPIPNPNPGPDDDYHEPPAPPPGAPPLPPAPPAPPPGNPPLPPAVP